MWECVFSGDTIGEECTPNKLGRLAWQKHDWCICFTHTNHDIPRGKPNTGTHTPNNTHGFVPKHNRFGRMRHYTQPKKRLCFGSELCVLFLGVHPVLANNRLRGFSPNRAPQAPDNFLPKWLFELPRKMSQIHTTETEQKNTHTQTPEEQKNRTSFQIGQPFPSQNRSFF